MITDEELARLDALVAREMLTGEDISEAFRLLPALVAEVRRLRSEIAGGAIDGWVAAGVDMYAATKRERDTLRAENERLRIQRDLDVACYDEVKRERDAALAEIERMLPVVEAALAWAIRHETHSGAKVRLAAEAYEAALAGKEQG